ncbi:MAG TPA: DUF4296 domain-containing protein [Flavobacteriaceae bacterium]|nr:DUF4296 domain-containing protein [Flavobacteriaceae bacterium]
MMKNIIYIIFALIILSACTSNTIYKKPENLLSKKMMADILTDMYIAEGARSVQNKELERLVDYMPLVYEKYKIDSIQFAESNFYYTTKIDDYEEILKTVDDRLKEMKLKYEEISKKEDSIKQSKNPEKYRSLEKPLPKEGIRTIEEEE